MNRKFSPVLSTFQTIITDVNSKTILRPDKLKKNNYDGKWRNENDEKMSTEQINGNLLSTWGISKIKGLKDRKLDDLVMKGFVDFSSKNI